MNLQPPKPVLELEGVDVPSTFDPRWAQIENLNWRVMEGESWLVGGSARSGKSSLLSVAAGLVRPLAGRQALFGADLAKLPEAEQKAKRLRVGMVFGGGGRLFAPWTVAQNLALPLLYHGHRPGMDERRRVQEILERLGISADAARFPRELARWVVQRVALARALVLQPDVLFLDDPANGLGDDELNWWLGFVEDCTKGGSIYGAAPRTVIVAAFDTRPWQMWAGRHAEVRGRSLVVLDAPATSVST